MQDRYCMAKGGAAMIEIICNGDDEAKEKNEKNVRQKFRLQNNI